MAEQRGDTPLPRVDEVDLSLILLEDIIESTHKERWQRFAHDNPELALEILMRARDIEPTNDKIELRKQIIDLVTFVVTALERALKRTSSS